MTKEEKVRPNPLEKALGVLKPDPTFNEKVEIGLNEMAHLKLGSKRS